MKYIFSLIILLFSNLIYADGLDEMRIYVNHKLIAVNYSGGNPQLLELEVSEGDTLTFEASTDWGGTDKATLSVFDYTSSEQILQLKRFPNTFEAIFEEVVKQDLMGSELLFVLNFNMKTNLNWKFARIILKKKAQ